MATTLVADPQRVPFVYITGPQAGKLTREGFLYLLGVRNTIPSDPSSDLETLQAGGADVTWQPQPVDAGGALFEPLLQPAASDAPLEPLLQPPPYVDLTGSTTITTLGTVTVGTWQATPLTAAYGGTGVTSYTTGDMLYASGATALSKLAAVATGNVLRAGGVGAAPAWGKVALTTDVSGVLPVANGGTGVSSLASLTASPSASVGLTAVNGAASTFMRSDAAPALSQAISPTWTGNHTFAPGAGDTTVTAGNFGVRTSTPASFGTLAVDTGLGTGGVVFGDLVTPANDTQLYLRTNNLGKLFVGGGGTLVFGIAAGAEFGRLNSTGLGLGVTPSAKLHVSGTVRVDTQATTGAQTASFVSTNKPGAAATSPGKWLPINLDGTTYYIPCWT